MVNAADAGVDMQNLIVPSLCDGTPHLPLGVLLDSRSGVRSARDSRTTWKADKISCVMWMLRASWAGSLRPPTRSPRVARAMP